MLADRDCSAGECAPYSRGVYSIHDSTVVEPIVGADQALKALKRSGEGL